MTGTIKLTEAQLNAIVRESAEKYLKEYAYHERQHQPTPEERDAWVARKSAIKKAYYERLKREKGGQPSSNSSAIDYYQYKHGDHPVMIKENELRGIIKESVTKLLSEISSDMLYRAADKASSLKQTNRIYTFQDAADATMKNEFGINDAESGIIDVTRRGFKYHGEKGTVCVVTSGGYYYIKTKTGFNNTQGNIGNTGEVPMELKTSNRKLARKLATWCSKYLEANIPGFNDWHSWCTF